MKIKILFLSLLIILGCSGSQQEQLIKDYVSVIDSVKSDLKFKLIQIKEGTPITVIDSIIYFIYERMPIKFIAAGDSFKITMLGNDGKPFEKQFEKSIIDTLLEINNEDKNLQLEIIHYNDSLEKALRKDMIVNFNPYIDYEHYINDAFNDISKAEKDLIDVNKEISVLEKAKEYSKLPLQTILSRSFDCTYSIFNPLLHVKQTLTKRFYFNSELTKVLGSSDLKK